MAYQKKYLAVSFNGDMINLASVLNVLMTENGVLLTGSEGQVIHYLPEPDADNRKLYRDEFVRVVKEFQSGKRPILQAA